MSLIPAVERIATYLDAGVSLIAARQTDKVDNGLEDWQAEIQGKVVPIFDEEHYPDDYFDESREGTLFFKLDKLKDYKQLPHAAIILADGTMFALPQQGGKHYETAAWLKYNGISLKDSIRVRYFPPSKGNRHGLFSVIADYDHKGDTHENNYLKLREQWFETYEYGSEKIPVILTYEQVRALYIIGTRLGYKVEQIFNGNPALCMDEIYSYGTNEERRAGRENNDSLDYVLNKLSGEELNVPAVKDPTSLCVL